MFGQQTQWMLSFSLFSLLFLSNGFSAPELHVGDGAALPGETISLPVNYIGEGTVTAIAFDLNYDSSKSIPDNAFKGTVPSNHRVFSHQLSDGRFRVVMY